MVLNFFDSVCHSLVTICAADQTALNNCSAGIVLVVGVPSRGLYIEVKLDIYDLVYKKNMLLSSSIYTFLQILDINFIDVCVSLGNDFVYKP